MNRKNIDMEQEYNKLLKWFEKGKGQRVLEVGVYNDEITEITFNPEDEVIRISLPRNKTLTVSEKEMKFLKIDKKYKDILMYLG